MNRVKNFKCKLKKSQNIFKIITLENTNMNIEYRYIRKTSCLQLLFY